MKVTSYEVIKLHSQRKNIVKTFIYLKHKTKLDDCYDKTTARLVANGAQQGQHTYNSISSSTIQTLSVMLLLNIASQYKTLAVRYDVKGAFLHTRFEPRDEGIYLLIPVKI
jgi:hypothetical protein